METTRFRTTRKEVAGALVRGIAETFTVSSGPAKQAELIELLYEMAQSRGMRAEETGDRKAAADSRLLSDIADELSERRVPNTCMRQLRDDCRCPVCRGA